MEAVRERWKMEGWLRAVLVLRVKMPLVYTVLGLSVFVLVPLCRTLVSYASVD